MRQNKTLFFLFIASCALSFCSQIFSFSSWKKPHFQEVRKHLEKLGRLPARFPGAWNHREAQKYIYDVLNRNGFHVYEQEFTKIYRQESLRMKNILGFKKGKKEKIVLLGTHYDTRRFADQEDEPSRKKMAVPGGNDGSSGTALLLAFADFLKNYTLDVSLLLAFFDAEDQGDIEKWPYSLGAKRFAAQPLPDLPDLAVIVDMICDRNLTLYYEKNTYPRFRKLYEEIWEIAQGLHYFEFVKEKKFAIVDDHLPLAQAGVPAALVIDLEYPFWHSIDDTVDKCSLESMKKVALVLWEWLKKQ